MQNQKIPNTLTLFDELNKLRKDPKSYSNKLEKFIEYFGNDNNIMRLPGRDIPIRVNEGKAVYEEAINYLKNHEPVEELILSRMLNDVAEEYANLIKDVEPSKINEVDLDALVDKRGIYDGRFQRTIVYGIDTEEQAIIKLVVSDGDKSRDEREALMSTKVKRVGMASAPHNKYHSVTVILSCTSIMDKNGKED